MYLWFSHLKNCVFWLFAFCCLRNKLQCINILSKFIFFVFFASAGQETQQLDDCNGNKNWLQPTSPQWVCWALQILFGWWWGHSQIPLGVSWKITNSEPPSTEGKWWQAGQAVSKNACHRHICQCWSQLKHDIWRKMHAIARKLCLMGYGQRGGTYRYREICTCMAWVTWILGTGKFCVLFSQINSP